MVRKRHRRDGRVRWSAAVAVVAMTALGTLAAARAGAAATGSAIDELKRLSIEDLGSVVVTSVSKSEERVADAAAAIYVIRHDEIMRSGATTLGDILRLAPNLQVAQLNATSYAITARGFNVGNNAAMSNKLLVLIDGRTVYTPLFAGVYWDMQEVPPETIDRIEVISGPGATLWGANAVNGVINIITRNTAETEGGFASIDAGNKQRGATLVYGGRSSPTFTWRAYGEATRFGSFATATGTGAPDSWDRSQGGFRMDWAPAGELLTVQGDAFFAPQTNGNVSGRNLVARWTKTLADGSSLQIQGYYDVAKRYSDDAGGFRVDTFDLSAQHAFKLGTSHEIVWGLGHRLVSYEIANTPGLVFQPATRTLDYANVFAQDAVTLAPGLKLTLGLKVENEPYTGPEVLPSARLAWKPLQDLLLWSAVSRAVRAATPVDRDLTERVAGVTLLDRPVDFRPESLTAYEAGLRLHISPAASLSVSGFLNDYDDLRSIELTNGRTPFRWGNLAAGRVYGVEVWGDWRAAPWWRLAAGFNFQHENLRFKPGSTGIGGTAFIADDPNHQAQLRSSVDLGGGITWDTFLRYVGKLHNPVVKEYAEVDLRVGWQVTPGLEIAVSGQNLVHARHPEFSEAGISDEVPRSFLVQTRLRF